MTGKREASESINKSRTGIIEIFKYLLAYILTQLKIDIELIKNFPYNVKIKMYSQRMIGSSLTFIETVELVVIKSPLHENHNLRCLKHKVVFNYPTLFLNGKKN
ncbi:MAG: hypothetical protein R1F52_07225 [Candidatus Nitrosoabyssus spongiisocia]|nr:MAG: hypothetical protein R1F52_07225 [Nitrosopumilaceae archaeon AB1(1)]